MSSDRLPCPVDFKADALVFGEFANAFRVLTDESGDTVLDFCVYAASDNVAKVVARVRVSPTFLAILDARISDVLVEGEITLRRAEGSRLRLGPNTGITH